MADLFDIVYIDDQIAGYPEPDTKVLARRVEALDRTHALLWWIRRELGLTLDPVTMFDDPANDLNGYRDHETECGCEVRLRFRTHELSRFERIRRGERTIPILDISCEPCERHRGRTTVDDSSKGRDWHGILRAWLHDPKLPDSFNRSRG